MIAAIISEFIDVHKHSELCEIVWTHDSYTCSILYNTDNSEKSGIPQTIFTFRLDMCSARIQSNPTRLQERGTWQSSLFDANAGWSSVPAEAVHMVCLTST